MNQITTLDIREDRYSKSKTFRLIYTKGSENVKIEIYGSQGWFSDSVTIKISELSSALIKLEVLS